MTADAFRAALRIPNFLQNLFGEGVLSASFIPVYARLNAENRHEEASESPKRSSACCSSPPLCSSPWNRRDALAHRRHRSRLPRGETPAHHSAGAYPFPGAGLLVFSAWCLGILNSHRKFLLSYTAPVLWNLAIIATFIWKGHQPESRLAASVAWGSVAGSALQFLAQMPAVLRFLWPLRVRFRIQLHSRSHGRRQLLPGIRKPGCRSNQFVYRRHPG